MDLQSLPKCIQTYQGVMLNLVEFVCNKQMVDARVGHVFLVIVPIIYVLPETIASFNDTKQINNNFSFNRQIRTSQ